MCRAFETAATASLPTPGGTNGTDIAVRVGEMLGRGWGAASAAGATAALAPEIVLVGGIAAPVFAAFAAVYGIGRISDRANELLRYNGFLVAFARSVSDFSRGTDRRRSNPVCLDASIQGRNAAIRVLTDLGRERRRDVLARYSRLQDQQAVDAVIASLGGMRTR